MKRRGFIRSLLLAAVAPSILAATAADRFQWKANRLAAPQWEGYILKVADGSGDLWVPRDYTGEWKFISDAGAVSPVEPHRIIHDLTVHRHGANRLFRVEQAQQDIIALTSDQGVIRAYNLAPNP